MISHPLMVDVNVSSGKEAQIQWGESWGDIADPKQSPPLLQRTNFSLTLSLAPCEMPTRTYASKQMVDHRRIHRLMRILEILRAPGKWTAECLAQELGVTQRTFYRDLRILNESDIKCSFDRKIGGYRVVRNPFLRPIDLTLEEALSLVSLAEQVGGPDQIPFTRAAARAVAKLRGQLPPGIRDAVEAFDHHLVIRLAQSATSEGTEDVYDQLCKAVVRHEVMRCRYEAAHSKQVKSDSWFLFHPYTLFFCQRAWYVIGHHAERNDLRSLKLSRFTALKRTGCQFKVPRFFSVDAFLGNAWRMMKGAQTHQVELWFDVEFAENVADTQWHRTQQVEWQPDGSLLFRCSVDGLDEIVWWVLSMGPHCVVRKPRELRQKVHALASGICRRYGDAL